MLKFVEKEEIIEDLSKIMEERGFTLSKLNDEAYIAKSGSLSMLIWLPNEDYLLIDDPVKFVERMGLNKVDSIMVVSYRAFYLADEVSKLIDTVRVWNGMYLNVKVYAVDIYRLGERLEETLNLALTTFSSKVSSINEPDGPCPQCGSQMLIKYRHSHRSLIYEKPVIEEILVCDKCMVKIHRVKVQ
ncbi:MAG: hypothetical protein ACP5H6_06255 [Caldivirga sp.]|jgi:DNA-directed RNA polymerase subunit RPC12/RpoP